MGIWIGFDILCGVGLAAGAFTLMATVHLFHIEKFKPIVRPTLLTGCLGYLLVRGTDVRPRPAVAHLGAIIYWNEHSVMFEVAWCVMLYTTVLTLEFSHIVFGAAELEVGAEHHARLNTPLVILGCLLSTLHQSSSARCT